MRIILRVADSGRIHVPCCDKTNSLGNIPSTVTLEVEYFALLKKLVHLVLWYSTFKHPQSI